MFRLFSVLLWTVVFLLLLLGIDQLLVRVPAKHPVHVAVVTFYRDLRSRALELAVRQPPAAPAKSVPPAKSLPATVETVIDQRQGQPAAPPSPPAVSGRPADDATLRYVYADERGELHFAGTLAEVPEQFRAQARALSVRE